MKQVIVMRTDLNMRKGKMIAQGAHAAFGCLIGDDISIPKLSLRPVEVSVPRYVADWINAGMKKICVRADSEEEFLELHAKAMAAGLKSFLVTDAGHTEFDGPTNTCIAIGPAYEVDIDKITAHLKLL